MMYMEDAIRATIDIMEAPKEQIKIRSSYNLAGFSFTPEMIYEEIKKLLPTIGLVPNYPITRQRLSFLLILFVGGLINLKGISANFHIFICV